MKASVVIRSKDEASRLRLTLHSLALQTVPVEVVVVNDGSRDHTKGILAEASNKMDLVCVHHPVAQGRSAASNAGAARASGEVLIFLDGDVLAAPNLAWGHLAAHANSDFCMARGETYHLRCTRFLSDPETGSPFDFAADRVARMSPGELKRSCITRKDIQHDFASIHRRGQPGIYPGAGPRLLYELEMAAIEGKGGSSVLWAAASGQNFSVKAKAFESVGGYDPELTINEHRELALRLQKAGYGMGAVRGAFSYHMTHRIGWRDPLQDDDWEAAFFSRHPIAEVALLKVLWDSLSETPRYPPHARLNTLPELAAAAERLGAYPTAEAARAAHVAASETSVPCPA